MKIKSLRYLDYWVGRPLCWILTVAYQIKKTVVRKGPVRDPKKILVIKLWGIGSIVLALPAMIAIKKKYAGSSIYFLTFKSNEAALSLTGVVPDQNIVTVRIDGPVNFLSDTVHALFFLIKEKIDVVIDLEFFSRFTSIFSFLIRSKHRIGFYGFHTEGLRRGNFIDFQVNFNHTLHTSRVFFTLLKPLGISEEDYSPTLPKIPPTEGFRKRITELITRDSKHISKGVEQWCVVNPNSSDLITLRAWPKEHFAELIALLLDTYDSLGVILIGGNSERPYVEALRENVLTQERASRIANLAGMTTIRDLIDIFYLSDLLISVDSGPAHLASLTDIRSLVLFGPETPALYSPLGNNAECLYLGLDCQPCVTVYNGKQSHCRNNLCLSRITPGIVFKAARRILETPSAGTPPPVQAEGSEWRK
ncbi:MAG TPA: glycosyltransferase family 9 protein [Thermodesulfovibrionales bacterium]|nr:glycosyltransferase family 9 protein [Thermodesulfovibrionales bacterium]